MTTTVKVILIVLLVAEIGSEASAQIVLRAGVSATGGGMMSNGTYAAAGTIGQSVIGRSIGTTYSASAGFWGDGGVVLGAEDPGTAELPAEFSLRQNYPNPFNPTTTIRYEVPTSTQVSLSVFDMLGRELCVLVNERRNAGVHEVKFDATGLSSGMYFYRLKAGDYIQTRKLLLVR